ncbi:MAG: EamA family transporter [Limisphaerales bacterium]
MRDAFAIQRDAEGNYQLLTAKEREQIAERGDVEALRDYWIARTELEKAVGGNLSGKTSMSEKVSSQKPESKPSTEINMKSTKEKNMNEWFWYAIGAAVLYGLHQIFTKLASENISDGLGGFVVEATAALTILGYLVYLRFAGKWNQSGTAGGVWYSVLTGVCVGFGTILFFLLFQKGGPLSAVPMILAGGAALMALAGVTFFREPVSPSRLAGIAFALVGLFLLRK